MTYWIIPFNPNYFRLADCLREHGYVEWTQRYKYKIGDIVFIYKYLLKPSEVDANADIPLGFRMLPLAENTSEKFTLDDLLLNGLKWVPQGGVKVKEPLLSYICSVFEQE